MEPDAPVPPEGSRSGGAPEVPEATPRRWAAGVGVQAVARFGHGISALVTMAALAQATKSLEAVGLFAVYESLFVLFDVCVDGGSGQALVRRGGREPASLRRNFAAALRFRVVAAAITSVLAVVVAGFDPRVEILHLGIVLGVANLFSHLLGTWVVPFHLQLTFAWPALARAACALAAVAATLAALGAGLHDPLLILGIHFAFRSIGNAAVWWKGRALLAQYPAPAAAAGSSDDADGTGFARESVQLGAGALLREGYGRLDVWLLRLLVGEAAAGLYAPARKTLQFALQFSSYVTVVAMPGLAARVGRSDQAALAATGTLARRMAWFSLPAALVTAPFIPWYLPAFFGEEFSAAVPALFWLAGAAAIAYPGSALMTGMVARGQAISALRISLYALLANLGANFLLVPAHGPTGAAVARVLTEGITLAGAALVLRRAAAKIG